MGIELRWPGLCSQRRISCAILLAPGLSFLVVFQVLLRAEESVPFPEAEVTGSCELPKLVLGSEPGTCGRAGSPLNP